MSTLAAVAFAAPWVLIPLMAIVRIRSSRSLDEYLPDSATDVPLVSIVIPVRNEVHNIERCVRSVLASNYPRLEVIAVDDHSTDGTGVMLRNLAAADHRLRIIVPPPLPPDWFGKQWACSSGQQASSGDIIGFFDADTHQSPDLVSRVVQAMKARSADLLTVGGRQELGSFWECVLQPQVFSMMVVRYGGTETVNAARRPTGKIANGQCLFVTREAYEAMGGHSAVRGKVAEDLALAQRFFLGGRVSVLIFGREQLSTRMYTSLREIVDGWGKNLYAGGRDAMPFGLAGRAIYPVALVLPSLMQLGPIVALGLWLAGTAVGSGVLLWATIAAIANLAWMVLVYRWIGAPLLYALLHPLGAVVVMYIAGRSIVRGNRVEWKGREYAAR